MNITNEEIKDEFKRQVKLCQGIGKKEMLNIINEFEFPKYFNSDEENAVWRRLHLGKNYPHD